MADETDTKQVTSFFKSVKHGFKKALPGQQQSRSRATDPHQRKKNQQEKRLSSETNGDSALSSEGSDFEGESLNTEMRACAMYANNLESPNSEKYPADKTRVHIMTRESRQGDGLLQLTDNFLGYFRETPVYQVDFKGKIDDPKTDLVWYFRRQGEDSDCVSVFLHMLDPKAQEARDTMEQSTSIPAENYLYRLCRYKVKEGYVLAVHKAPEATVPFSDDDDGLMDVCYHETKGGQVTFCMGDGKVLGTTSDGEVRVFKQTAWADYCTNPFTLFYIYDDGVVGFQGVDDVDGDGEEETTNEREIRTSGEN